MKKLILLIVLGLLFACNNIPSSVRESRQVDKGSVQWEVEYFTDSTEVIGPDGKKYYYIFTGPQSWTNMSTGEKCGCTDHLAGNYCPTCDCDDGTCWYYGVNPPSGTE